ncbi:MAG: 50S ribosomal protein L25 [Gaiellales bacterium]
MAGDRITLVVQPRDRLGSRETRRLRRNGRIPGILYGSGEPRAFSVDQLELRRALTGGHGFHQILDVVLEGQAKPHHAILKEYQLDPLRSTLTHVDLHEVRLDRPIQTQVAIELIGTPVGVTMGGLLQQILRETAVEALPASIPERLELDVSALEIGDALRLSDVVAPASVTLLDDPASVVASVVTSRRALSEEEEAAEGAEAAEGEAGAAPGAEAEAEAGES